MFEAAWGGRAPWEDGTSTAYLGQIIRLEGSKEGARQFIIFLPPPNHSLPAPNSTLECIQRLFGKTGYPARHKGDAQ